jgi:hypothetical protein
MITTSLEKSGKITQKWEGLFTWSSKDPFWSAINSKFRARLPFKKMRGMI